MRGKYQRRRQARIERENGDSQQTVVINQDPTGSTLTVAMCGVRSKAIHHDATPAEVAEATRDLPVTVTMATAESNLVARFEAAVVEAQKLKRAKKKGCSNLDRNMEALGYRRVSGDEMVPEQFEAIR